MNPYFEKLKNNLLIKVSSFNAIGVIVMSASSLVSAKVIAVFLGAEGMALLGNFRNMLTAVQSISTLGLYNGIVKYIAEYKNDVKELRNMISTSYYACFLVSICLSVWLYFDPEFWNQQIFGVHYDFRHIFKAIAIAIPFYTINMLCLAVINGFSKYKVYVLLNIIGSLLGVVITVIFIWKLGLEGAFFALIINPAISLLITISIIVYQKDLLKFFRFHKSSFKYVKLLGAYSIMALITALLVPFVKIKIRNYIITTNTIVDSGYWEAMQRISNQYLLFVTTLLTLYLLPNLSKTKDGKGFKKEIISFYKVILPIFGGGLLMIYMLKTVIVSIALSEDFLPMIPIFKWQLAGDFIKVMSLVISYQFLAKNMFWHYVITECISIIFLYVSSIYLIDRYGYIGASMAHLCNYIFYFILLLWVFRRSLFNGNSSNLFSK